MSERETCGDSSRLGHTGMVVTLLQHQIRNSKHHAILKSERYAVIILHQAGVKTHAVENRRRFLALQIDSD